jgi:ABC-type glycerol-3-phosphate transport system substrate-binding protein
MAMHINRHFKGAACATTILVSSLALAACSSSNSGPASGTSDAAPDNPAVEAWAAEVRDQVGDTTITIAAQTHPSTEAMRALTPAFTELTGIKVEWDINDEGSLVQKIELDAQSSAAGYDVIAVDSFYMNDFANRGIAQNVSGRVADLPEFYDYEDILPAYATGLGSVEDEVYGLPTAGETRFLAYRTDLFEEAGLDAPTNTDELLEAARYFTGGKDGTYGIAMRAQRGGHFTSGWLTLLYQFSDGLFEPDGTPALTSSENVEALQYFIDLLSTGPADISSYTHEESLSAFAAGHVAMWMDSTAIAASILDPEQSVVTDKVAFTRPPTGENGRYGALAGWTLALPKNTTNADAAWAFITYMTSRAMAPAYIAAGGVPTRTSTLESPTTPKEELYYPAMLEALEDAGALVSRGIAWIPRVDDVYAKIVSIGNYGNEALVGSITAKEALDKASAEIG